MSDGFWAYGSLLQMGDGNTPENFTTVAEVLDFATPAATRDRIDMTNHSSPGGYEDKIPTLKRTGDVTFDVNWIPSDPTHDNATGLTSKYDSGDLVNWRIIASDEDQSEVLFAGYVMGFTGRLPVNGGGRGSVTIMPTGVVTWP